jgi:hypothetical protein
VASRCPACTRSTPAARTRLALRFGLSSAADLIDVRQGGGTVGAVFAGLPSWWRWTYPALAVFWIALAVGKAVTGHTAWAMMYGVLAAGWVVLTLVAFLWPQGWRR